MTLRQLTLIKRWQVAHRRQHPLEYHTWDMVLTGWLMGCVGTPLALLLWPWLLPLGLTLCMLPGLYVGWRRRLHLRGRLRCDWLCVIALRA